MDDTPVSNNPDGRIAQRNALPVLDLEPFLAGEDGAEERLALELRAACESLGFFYLKNHGIDKGLIKRAFTETERFHSQSQEAKNALTINQNQRGYIRPGATLVRHSTYNENTKFDSNETMVLATEYGPDDPNRLAGKRFYGENQWPEDLPGFRETVEEYMQTMTAFGKSLLPIWARALDLPRGFFAPYFENNYTYLRLAHYPPVPDLGDNEFGLGPHADTGFMTLLPQADVDGLEVLDPDGNWFRPPRMAGEILVNTGQFAERWSNERFRASPHRVIPPIDKDRYSVAVFVNTAFEPVCECLPGCCSPDNPPKYGPETYWDFYNWYMTNAYPHYDEFAEGTA
ncbi:MAG: 2-oxoglutarate and iron-dependent oxygenase domain-containing protein [Rhodospirillales bacterium]|jgi:isopenicillin N synthase-like dioxygenase|nr:2OG-Fe(II) oxygenase [Rhodospirillaceae bacterium]MDP6428966.1 2-oxoglutarate and iron-dependent oxygenase domain-containing protein [Rhodospirillales bacterium]MDP6645281.1 2-oxoglutarate and iron-dependent oxygenase domain-containing protein [Rhodospirillales bacterium]MDP6842754.1 2-oxoglutarate and iron-dependent oxygenase domain-containing protein [Rhodospirillales bacterium]|tara:strand:- start:488 stop:1516 length:1029 start_codon:yes stop_codon:yes gene_type:complete